MKECHRITVVLLLALTATARGEVTATAEFEGGSAVIESIDQETNTIRMTPGTNPQRGWACWWYLKVDGITPGDAVTIDLGVNPRQKLSAGWMMPQRAHFSTDGETWQHTQPGKRSGTRITYTQTIDAKQAWFAWGPPFTPSDAAAFVKRIAKRSPHAEAFILCKTNGGRDVPALRIREGDTPDEQRRGVWINARQHAWESGSSWVGVGLTEWLVSDDERAAALRRKADIYIVPIMDVDNTAVGAGGKNAQPHDHNRDWSAEPRYASVRAATERIAALNKAGRFDLYIDLHNPGPNDNRPFYFVSPADMLSDRGKANLARFFAAAQTEITGPLKLADKTRPSGSNYDKAWQRISKNWVTANTADHVVAVTLETSWNTPHSHVEGYKTVGRQQGLAIERYLRGEDAK